MLADLTRQLAAGQSLTEEQVRSSVALLIDEGIAAEAKADFLGALSRRGESPEEIAAFAHRLREHSLSPPLDPVLRAGEILDVVGTGGDCANTFNISSTTALVCAAAGVVVAKHGNRAITSRAGSADVLEALGVPIEHSPEQAAAALREHGFAFFFAPRFHPAFKHIGPARKLCAARGQRTIFNLLGPLLNPARPSAMLVGVPRPDLCEPIARALQSLGVRRAMVVCGEVPGTGEAPRLTPHASLPTQPARGHSQEVDPAVHLDEVSTLGETVVAEFYQDHGFHMSKFSPGNLPLQPATLSDLAGGDREQNAAITRAILRGDERGPKRDAVLLNAGAALFVAGRAGSIAEGWELAGRVIAEGRAWAKLESLRRTA